jgi:hypothetical protein
MGLLMCDTGSAYHAVSYSHAIALLFIHAIHAQEYWKMIVHKVARRSLLTATLSLIVLLAACSEPTTSAPRSAAPDQGAYNLTLNMAEFMNLVLEPVADSLWKSAGWVLDETEGYYELYPTDDAGWAAVRSQAAMIVEAGNAMMLPGRAIEEGAWRTYSQAMSTVGLTAMRAAQDQNEEDLFQAGAQLYSVCTACHQAYNPDILSRFTPGSLTD